MLTLITISGAGVVPQLNPQPPELENPPSSIIPWTGFANTPGAFLISRINLDFLNNTCTQFSSTLLVATQVAEVLIDTQLQGAQNTQVKRYGYLVIVMESEFKNTLIYLTNLLLCSGRGTELWDRYRDFKNKIAIAWALLKNSNKLQTITTNNVALRESEKTELPFVSVNNSHKHIPLKISNDSLMDILNEFRPSSREPKSPLAIGVGLGFVANYLLRQIFSSKDSQDIARINQQLINHNKLIKLTNTRIDLLAKNVSKTHETIKKILDKMIETREKSNIHYALLWNFDQLITNAINAKTTFQLGELSLTLLNHGVINADLLDLNSFKKIIAEGLKLFPHSEFPVEINRYNLNAIVSLLNVQKVSRLQYLMVIPLVHKRRYKIYSIIPHPVQLSQNHLVIPEVKSILLKSNNDTYVITNPNNVHSLPANRHILLNVEPIYKQSKLTCEWSTYMRNISLMVKYCIFKKFGQLNDTMVVETENNRLVYFNQPTAVDLICPNKNIHSSMNGLHRIPINCDIETKDVLWPSKQSVTIDVPNNDSSSFFLDATLMPIINLNQSNEVHDSLRELINKLPKENDPLTIDFDYYGLSTDQVQTYTIYSQSILTIVVTINSILIGFLFIKWLISRSNKLSSFSRTVRDSFRDSSRRNIRRLSDNIRNRKNKSTHKRLRKLRSSIRSRGSSIGSSVRSKGSQLKNKIKNDIMATFHSDNPSDYRNTNVANYHNTPELKDIGTNTELNESSSKVKELYPIIPRYIS